MECVGVSHTDILIKILINHNNGGDSNMLGWGIVTCQCGKDGKLDYDVTWGKVKQT